MDPVKIIARFRDGSIIKGFSQDFFPSKSSFHLNKDLTSTSADLINVQVTDLKAVFFARTFEGNPKHNERKIFIKGDKPSGRKAEVTFEDDEVIQGSVLGYNANQAGFFLFPVDPNSNNMRIFVINAAVKNFRFL
ncbi:MAG: DUF6982 domain-containing protein [Candidatus Hodarchaeota archaeon]